MSSSPQPVASYHWQLAILCLFYVAGRAEVLSYEARFEATLRTCVFFSLQLESVELQGGDLSADDVTEEIFSFWESAVTSSARVRWDGLVELVEDRARISKEVDDAESIAVGLLKSCQPRSADEPKHSKTFLNEVACQVYLCLLDLDLVPTRVCMHGYDKINILECLLTDDL